MKNTRIDVGSQGGVHSTVQEYINGELAQGGSVGGGGKGTIWDILGGGAEGTPGWLGC